MSDGTKIEWTDATVNAINGCTVVSPGCTNCYAMRLAGTRMKSHPSRAGLTQDSKAGPVWTGEVRLNKLALVQPLGWRKPRRLFWNAHGDMFHPSVPEWWIDWCFAVMAATPQHIHQVLTKRSDRMKSYFADPETIMRIGARQSEIDPSATAYERVDLDAIWPLANVWLGVSVEDQARADKRVPDLLATPAAVRWLSCEPLLGPVDLRWLAEPDDDKDGVIDALLGCNWVEVPGTDFHPARPGHHDRRMGRWVVSSDEELLAGRKLDWVVVGGESGAGSRPMHSDWARSLRDQCLAAGVPFFFKQWGDWIPSPSPEATIAVRPTRRDFMDHQGWDGAMIRVGKRVAGRLIDGVQHDGMPGAAA